MILNTLHVPFEYKVLTHSKRLKEGAHVILIRQDDLMRTVILGDVIVIRKTGITIRSNLANVWVESENHNFQVKIARDKQHLRAQQNLLKNSF